MPYLRCSASHGAPRIVRALHGNLCLFRGRVRAAEDTPGDLYSVLERRRRPRGGRRAWRRRVVEGPRVKRPLLIETSLLSRATRRNTGKIFAQQRPAFKRFRRTMARSRRTRHAVAPLGEPPPRRDDCDGEHLHGGPADARDVSQTVVALSVESPQAWALQRSAGRRSRHRAPDTGEPRRSSWACSRRARTRRPGMHGGTAAPEIGGQASLDFFGTRLGRDLDACLRSCSAAVVCTAGVLQSLERYKTEQRCARNRSGYRPRPRRSSNAAARARPRT